MKLFRRLSLLLFGTLLVLSCGLNPGSGSGSGDLIIDLGFAKGSQDTARVWILTTNNVLVSIGSGGAPYAEVSLAAGTTEVVVDNIPAGVDYQVYFALGNKDTGFFRVEKYGVSGVFSVTGGTEESVALGPLSATPFTYSNAVGSFKGVVVTGGQIYAPTANALYKGGTIGAISLNDNLASYNINSISLGAAIDGSGTIWLNTNKGILPTTGVPGGFTFNFAQTHKDDQGNPISVLNSGYFTNGVDDYVLLQRDGGLGGVHDTGATTFSTWNWIDIDLSDVITGQPVKDMVLIPTGAIAGAFFATKLGAFYIADDFLDSGSTDFLNPAYTTFFGESLGLTVISLAYDATKGFVLGAEEGLYTTMNPLVSIDLVPDTSGRVFSRVSISDNDDIAALSTYFLWVKKSGASGFTRYPFAAGLPGNVTGMAWVGAGQLVISGTEGLVQITLP